MRGERVARGFSLIEMLVVIAIVAVMTAAAVIQIWPALQRAKAETALQTTLGQIRRAHELAIDQRRIYRLTFVPPRTIQLAYAGLDTNTPPNQIWIASSSIDLPVETQFAAVTGIPKVPGTTPDGLGTGTNAIDFSVDYGGGGTAIYFQPDGRALDILNRLNNGVVYVARPAELMSSGAVSLWGATGRAKGWHLVLNNNNVEWRP